MREVDPLDRSRSILGRQLFLAVLLAGILMAVWMVWSGHTEPWLLTLGLISVLSVVLLTWRLQILDDETVPIGLNWRLPGYLLWLAKEIVRANIDVARRILNPSLPIRPAVVRFSASPRTELGRVILANSITLTPGTVSVDLQGESIWVHALAYSGNPADVGEAMDRRVVAMEKEVPCTES